MNIEAIRQIDLLAVCLLLGLEPDPKDKRQFKGDGFRISVTGLKWYDHSASKGGFGAIDLIMHIRQVSFTGATNQLSDISGQLPLITHQARDTKQRNPATTPPTANKNNLPVILAYLTQKRGLNACMVRWCMDRGLIYADSRSNCVFKYGNLGAELRGTGSVQWRGVYGQIERGFILPTRRAAGVAVLESAIDALSYRQLHPNMITVSIAGNGNHKVIQQAVSIAKAKQLPILSAFDSDAGGDIADKILTEYAQREGVELIQDRPTTKDWNDALKNTR